MKGVKLLIVVLILLSSISGVLLSKASLVGKAGMSLFYKEYSFLKVWWQAALVIMIFFLLFLLLQGLVLKKLDRGTANIIQVVAIVIALTGLYFTYNDFRETLTHRILGERFHLGGYLFWIGWLLISLFYLTRPHTNVDYESTAIE